MGHIENYNIGVASNIVQNKITSPRSYFYIIHYGDFDSTGKKARNALHIQENITNNEHVNIHGFSVSNIKIEIGDLYHKP